MKYQYYTHRNNSDSTLYRFPLGNITDYSGQFFGEYDKEWSIPLVSVSIISNWTEISRKEARKNYPFAFRRDKSAKEIGDGLKDYAFGLGEISNKIGLKLKDNPFKKTTQHYHWWNLGFENYKK